MRTKTLFFLAAIAAAILSLAVAAAVHAQGANQCSHRCSTEEAECTKGAAAMMNQCMKSCKSGPANVICTKQCEAQESETLKQCPAKEKSCQQGCAKKTGTDLDLSEPSAGFRPLKLLDVSVPPAELR